MALSAVTVSRIADALKDDIIEHILRKREI